jgi:ferredoxin
MPKKIYTVRGGCVFCMTCETVCPVKAVRVKSDGAHIDPLLCIGCGRCMENCHVEAIEVVDLSNETQPERKAL